MWVESEEMDACIKAVMRLQDMPKRRATEIVAAVFTAYESARQERDRKHRLREIVRDYEM